MRGTMLFGFFALALVALMLVLVQTQNADAAPRAQCKDKIDNDADGRIDYPADSGCTSVNDNSENSDATPTPTVPPSPTPNATISPTPEPSPTATPTISPSPTVTPSPTPIPDNCADSDGGLAYNLLGTVSGYSYGSPYSIDDFCMSTEVLLEYYCDGTQPNAANYTCASGCFAGACG